MSASSYPVLYLNLLEQEGKSFIKFYYKTNPQISKKLQECEWVKYSRQYRCYLTSFSNDKLLLIKESFSDQAVIDTQYLRRKSQAPAGRTVITTGQPVLSTYLPKPSTKPMLRLLPFQHAGKTYLKLFYPPESNFYKKLKILNQVKWSRTIYCSFTNPVLSREVPFGG